MNRLLSNRNLKRIDDPATPGAGAGGGGVVDALEVAVREQAVHWSSVVSVDRGVMVRAGVSPMPVKSGKGIDGAMIDVR